MPKKTDNDWTCDFGSGSRLCIGLNSEHIVLAIDESGDAAKRSSIAFKPSTLHDLATRLLLLAETYNPGLKRSMFIADHDLFCRDDLAEALAKARGE